MPSFSASVSMSTTTAQFVTSMLGCLTSVRTYHWASTSYSEHQALGELYDDFSDLLDEFVEQFQGIYGLLDRKKIGSLYTPDDAPALDYLREVREHIGEMRRLSSFSQETSLQNLIDEIVGKFDRTIYKLATLK